MPDLSGLRFVEIGPPYLKHVFPDQTECFSTAHDLVEADPAGGLFNVSLATLPRLYRAVRAPDVSLIVCRPVMFSPWHWRWLARAVFDRRSLQGRFMFMKAVGPQLLRLPVTAPLAVVDFEDVPFINRSQFFLLERCRRYFKRELPPDRWRLFMKTAHANLPTPRFRRLARYRRWIDKIRPISLGLPLGRETLLPVEAGQKTTDVFFAGLTEANSTVRTAGLAQLLALRERGVVVDIPETRIPPQEFYQRCARAWLTWSPEGLGWDCFRHYEALACGSVPVINQPSIERHRPLERDQHAFYYDPEPGGLTQVIERALADKERLRAMAREGKAHVLAHHTPKAMASYIVETALELANGSKAGENEIGCGSD